MSPCLSGWDRGEEKQAYMAQCHKVLSRSQLYAVNKLRDAGILTRNLVVLPTLSNISLANNGTHLSMGGLPVEPTAGGSGLRFRSAGRKVAGGPGHQNREHFLPLFVGTYSGAPYRLGLRRHASRAGPGISPP